MESFVVVYFHVLLMWNSSLIDAQIYLLERREWHSFIEIKVKVSWYPFQLLYLLVRLSFWPHWHSMRFLWLQTTYGCNSEIQCRDTVAYFHPSMDMIPTCTSLSTGSPNCQCSHPPMIHLSIYLSKNTNKPTISFNLFQYPIV